MTVGCEAYYEKLPVLTFKIGSTDYQLSPEAYAINAAFPETGLNICASPISYDLYNTDTIVLGQTFLSQFVPTYNFDKNTVSFG